MMASSTRLWVGNKALGRLAVPIGELTPHGRNPRRGDVDEIRKSLDRFGQQRPILALPDGTIVAGHHVYYAATVLGWTHVAAIRSDLTDEEVDAYLIADNRTAEKGTNDEALLAEILKEQYDAGRLEGTGYSPDDYEDLLVELDRVSRLAAEEFKGDYAETAEQLAARAARRGAGVSIREVVLTLSVEQAERFAVNVAVLRKEWSISGVTDTVFRAVEEAAVNARTEVAQVEADGGS